MSKVVTIELFEDRVLLKVLEPKKESNFILPDEEIKSNRGEVIKVGGGRRIPDGTKVIPMRVKEGDQVIFEDYGHQELEFDGVKYIITREEYIICKI